MSIARKHRGFVLIIILAVTAVLAAIVGSQYTTSAKAGVAALRSTEDVEARGVAEACLSMLTAFVNQYDPTPDVGDDFDDILAGPDHSPGTADDYLFFNTTPVFIPQAAASIGSVAQKRLHQWNIIDIPGSGGVCAARVDDNSDDGRPAPSGAPEAGENTNVDVPNKDSDRSVFITVIGMFPANAPFNDDTYEKAHAHVTLRRAVQLPNVVQPLAPALWAGRDVLMDDSNLVCSKGGITAGNKIQVDKKSCECGVLQDNTGLSDPSLSKAGTVCSACAFAGVPSPSCISTSRNTAPPTVPPPLSVHYGAPGNFMANEGIGRPRLVPVVEVSGTSAGHLAGVDDPALVPASLADDGVCNFFGTNDGKLFVWDPHDTAARTTLAGAAFANVALQGVPTDDDCTSAAVAATATLPRPCDWGEVDNAGQLVGQAAVPSPYTPFSGKWTVNCGVGQSLCWKIIADLDGGLEDGNIRIGDQGAATGGITEWSRAVTATSEEWHPHANVAVPNVFGGAVFGAAANRLCGNAASCSQCSTAGFPSTTDNTSSAVVFDQATKWKLLDSRNDRMPAPSIFVFDGNLRMDNVGQNAGTGAIAGLWRGTVLVNGNITVVNQLNMSCARCNVPAALGTSTDIDSPDGCELTRTLGGGKAPNGDPIPRAVYAANDLDPSDSDVDIPGFAIKATGTVTVNKAFAAIDVIGDIRAGTVKISEDDACVVGNIVAYGGAPSCTTAKGCGSSNLCIDDDSRFIGDLHSMTGISVDKNPKVYGNVVAKANSACFSDGAKVEGVVQAGLDVRFDDTALIANTTSSSGGTPTIANQALTTYLESSW